MWQRKLFAANDFSARQKSEKKFLSPAHSILGLLNGQYRAKLGGSTLQDLAKINM